MGKPKIDERELMSAACVLHRMMFEIFDDILEEMGLFLHQQNGEAPCTIMSSLISGLNSRRDAIMVRGEEPVQNDLDLFRKFWLHPLAQRAFKSVQLTRASSSFQAAADLFNDPAVYDIAFVPSVDQFMKYRVRTTGIIELDYSNNPTPQLSAPIKLFDVGGSRNERRKWIHCFEGLHTILFTAALDHFTSICFEDFDTCRMFDSLQCFSEVCNSPFFNHTRIVLVLTFRDRLEHCLGELV
jgi:hypothetical protein